MKISQLKKIIKESVKEAIQEEMKDILIEAVRAPKQVVSEYKPSEVNVGQPSPTNPVAQTNLPEKDKLKLRENMMSVLDGMMPGADGTLSATSANVPLKVQGPMDTTSANGSLPDGNVSMDQIMGLMNSKG
jgi:hypothetical protein|tara:strand:- start:371 stop:763 length:393 start_codon:yes stop_codon:yes gene_type:complete